MSAGQRDAPQADALRLADELAALRRVAVLAAGGAPPDEVLAAIAIEASALLGGKFMTLSRFDEDGSSCIVVAVSGDHAPLGVRFPVGTDSIAARIRRSGSAERIDDYTGIPGTEIVAALGLRAAVGVPITVGGRLWGVLGASSGGEPLPADTEDRLTQFAEIVSAAISSAQARGDLRALALEQAALLRVAALVAAGAGENELFDAVAVEAAALIDNEPTTLVRYEGDRTFTVVATCGGPASVGSSFVIGADDRGTLDEMLRTGRSARLDDYSAVSGPLFSRDAYGVGSSVVVPITVEGKLWGSLGTLTNGRRLPLEAEARLEQFAELIAAALANSQARAQIQHLADEQSALRRVAELVAGGAALGEVFPAIAFETSRLLGDDAAALMRYDTDGFATVVAARNSPAPLGMRVPSDGHGLKEVLATGRSVRVDTFEGTNLAAVARTLDVHTGVAVPITVEGRIWGALTTSTSGPPPPPGTEQKLEAFAELAAAAIASAETRSELIASRARVVATADETRRRLQRDVHDGAQQRLVQTVIALKLGREAAADGKPTADLIDEALRYAERATAELRDLAHGILPASLSRGGLRSGLESLIADFSLPVQLEVAVPRLRPTIETTAYFIVAEALTNVVKHAQATGARVSITTDGSMLIIEVSDDGIGGADPSAGSGLTGLLDRIGAAAGTLSVASAAGQGTTVRAQLPIDGD